jgi:hypothetical protein
VRSAWRDEEEGYEYPSIAAMRTAKASAILDHYSLFPEMRFGIVRIEDLMQDSEVVRKKVILCIFLCGKKESNQVKSTVLRKI